jgi:hypothetical protein
MKENNNDTYYFYKGFEAPEKIEDINDLMIITSHKGDITEDMINAHLEFLHYDDEDYNNYMYKYGVIRNPKLSDFIYLNTYIYGLREDQYLKTFIEDTIIKGDIVKREIYKNIPSDYSLVQIERCLVNELYSVYTNLDEFFESHLNEEDGLDITYLREEHEYFTIKDGLVVDIYWSELTE